jgi:hypothetical protein
LILSFCIEIKVFENFIFSLTAVFLSNWRKKTRCFHLLLVNMLSGRGVPSLAAVRVAASEINMCGLIIQLVSHECVAMVSV